MFGGMEPKRITTREMKTKLQKFWRYADRASQYIYLNN